jgi:predicted Zn-dependent protease with MMP-like domain
VAAREALAELATSVIDDAELAFDLAELALTAHDTDRAMRWTEAARKAAPDDPSMQADALHLLGRIHEESNDRDAMIVAWQQVRVLDEAAPSGPLTVSEDEVERIALATLAELPANIRKHLEKVPILIDDLPSEGIVDEGWDPRILGIFQGIPLPQDGVATASVLFRKNLERSCASAKELAEEIRITVLHETAHYFGLDDDDLDALGLG